MGVFNPTLKTEVAFEQPIQAPKQYSAVTDIANLATASMKTFAKAPTSSTIKQQQLSQFGTELKRAMDLKEQGKPFKTVADNAAIALVTSGISDVPDELKNLYRGITGSDFGVIGYDNEDEYYRDQLLSSEAAMSLSTAIKIKNPKMSADQVDDAVIDSIAETAFHEQSVARQNARSAAGLPVETTPIVQSIQNDFDILSTKVSEYQQDGIVTRDEYLSATTSLRSLISTKYANFNNNPEVKAIQDQMFGMLDDIGKGVSTDPLEVQLDAVQVALTQANFSPATVATIRSLIKTNPQSFQQIIEKQLGERGDSFVDALSGIWNSSATGSKLEDIFGTRPELASASGQNPSLLSIPNVDEDPKAYSKVVEGLSAVTANAKPNNINNSEDARNEWLNATNILGSLVASQSDDYVLGEKLLNSFASNGVIANLESVYRTDPLNAAQTNDVLQEALSSERIRQENELNSRLASGDGEYFLVDANTGELKLNLDPFRQRVEGGRVPQGSRRLAELERVVSAIEESGGLEKFFNLPQTRKDKILQGSSFDRIFGAKLGDSFKLINNIKLIDSKLVGLKGLQTKYAKSAVAFDPEVESIVQDTNTALQSGLGPNAITSPQLGIVARNRPEAADVPYRFTGKTDEEQEEEFNNLASGSLFIDPDTGLLARKN